MPEIMEVRAVVFDPSPLFFEGISAYLNRGGYVTLGQAQSLENLLHRLGSLSPSLVIVGPDLTEHESLAACRAITDRWPDIKTIVITAEAADPLFQTDAVHAGVAACLPRDVGHEECLAAVAAVMAGHRLFSREILSPAFRPVDLTPREREVLKLLAEGKTDREIACALA